MLSISSNKLIEQCDLETKKVLRRYRSFDEINDAFGFESVIIYSCCTGNQADAYGFYWRLSEGILIIFYCLFHTKRLR